MSERTPDDARPRIPRVAIGVIVGAIALASLAALLSPGLRASQLIAGPSAVGVIRRLVDAPDQAARISALAPDFEWNAPDSTTKRLSDLRGKVVVINFWATWCVPCRTEMPAFERVANSTDALFLAVDLQEDGATVRAFMDSLRLDHLMPLLDTDGAITRRYGVVALPQTFFVDSRGVIQHIEHGQVLDETAVRRGIDKAR